MASKVRALAALELRPAKATAPSPRPVPASLLRAVDAERTVFRTRAANGDTIVWAERARSMPLSKRRVLFVARGKEVRAAFDMPRPAGDASFRELLHGDGSTYLYANDDRVWELKVGEKVAWRQAWHAKQKGRGPAEAVPLRGCIACMMHSRAITVLSPKWKKTASIGLDALGFVQLARSDDGTRLLVCSYDTRSTAGGPVLSAGIVLYEVIRGGLIERARGDGHGRDPFFVGGRFYVTQKRRVHVVEEVSRAAPAPRGERFVDRELEIDLGQKSVRVCGRDAALSSDELALLWFFVERIDELVTYAAYARHHLGKKHVAAEDRLFDGRVARLRRKLEDKGFSDRLVDADDGSGYTFVR